jgi:hypothetical protein
MHVDVPSLAERLQNRVDVDSSTVRPDNGMYAILATGPAINLTKY